MVTLHVLTSVKMRSCDWHFSVCCHPRLACIYNLNPALVSQYHRKKRFLIIRVMFLYVSVCFCMFLYVSACQMSYVSSLVPINLSITWCGCLIAPGNKNFHSKEICQLSLPNLAGFFSESPRGLFSSCVRKLCRWKHGIVLKINWWLVWHEGRVHIPCTIWVIMSLYENSRWTESGCPVFIVLVLVMYISAAGLSTCKTFHVQCMSSQNCNLLSQ